MFASTMTKEVFRVLNVSKDSIRLMHRCPNLRDLGPDAYRVEKLVLREEIEFPTERPEPNAGRFTWDKWQALMNVINARLVHYLERVELVFAEIPESRPDPAGQFPAESYPDFSDPFEGTDLLALNCTLTPAGRRALAERVA